MERTMEFAIKEIILENSLYPSEKNERLDPSYPINELLLRDGSKPWGELLENYINMNFEDHEEENIFFVHEEHTGSVFTTFYPEFLKVAQHYLDEKIKDLGTYHNLSDFCELDNMKASMVEYIRSELSYLSIRILIQDLNEERENGRLVGTNPRERYKYYTEHILTKKDKKVELLKKYPILTRILFESIVLHVDSVIEMLARFAEDRTEISEKYDLSAADKLTSLTLQLGDKHNKGRSVVILGFVSGKKIVYKPRSLSIDEHFQQFLNWINTKKSPDSLELKTLTIINKQVYGWQEYVEYKPCDSKNGILRFYERQGYYLAILYLLNAADFHYENLIACGEHPMMIDLEGLLQNAKRSAEKGTSAYDVAFDRLTESVLSTGMLPITYIKANFLNFDFSGLGGEEGQPIGQDTFTIENSHTDEMRVVKVQAFSESSKNRPFVEGAEVETASQYGDLIAKGFSKLYRLLLENKHKLLQSSGPLYKFKNDQVRIILRSTQVYSTFIDSSLHPDYIIKGENRERLINFMWLGKVNRPEFADTIMYECHDLLKGDIPYFYCTADSTALFHPIGKVKSDFFPSTSFDYLLERVNSLSSKDLETQLDFIQNSLVSQYASKNDKHVQARPEVHTSYENFSIMMPDELLAISERIAGIISDKAIYGKDNDVTWLGLSLDIHDQFKFRPLEFDLYDGVLGIGLYYANLYHVTKKDKYKFLAEKCMQTAINHIHSPLADIPVSAFYGYGAFAYVFANYSIIFDDQTYLSQVKYVLDKALSRIEEDHLLDFLGGVSGLIIVCINLYKKTGETYFLDIAKQCGDHLIRKKEIQMVGVGWRTKQVEKPLTGLSHGASGFSWPLLWLYKFTNDQKYEEAYLESMKYEKSLFDKNAEIWLDLRAEADHHGSAMWCHGSAGIGMSRIMMSEYVSSSEIMHEIDLALKYTQINGFSGNYCLCHGDLGNLDLFLLAADRFQRDDFKMTALKIGSHLAVNFSEKHWKLGSPGINPGLMLGQAGTGYGFLRLAYPDLVPSLLTLELNK
ncbi:type 2 lanthipeptide synthetase LanM family protein [Paenibacillus ehimensis]|uniref:type 2 lanthipeptide synthetase LanM family protein n=1 Tax=Paenibacillus ehimensis TaxID=79264 RepID=UPI000FD956C3|nr:type 2 lanthipeptide synthetase LanM family protein [Paenibacillus ehimensis]